jgi:uncharacterized caspase-like protein
MEEFLDRQRRQLIRCAIGGATLFAPGPWAWVWAQGAQGPQLHRLPKIALVIGNASYRQSPLKNPANDAKGMAEALNALGFDVTVRIDASRAAMQAAIDAHVAQLASRKCVGLFYFAGHGVQINWKNYLIPADAEIASNADVEARAVEVNVMVAGLKKAGNALNLIILDACRDAPFGEAKKPEQKGLSQMDAPRSTLLAYATAPGNVASDGAGSNGLYTENLLREIRAPEAKVEDVFKRVRLAVRRSSNGSQIPWESTSLEDDFYFKPPASLAPPSDKEREARFAAELALWEKIESAMAVEPIEEYLRRYPSGNFAELALLRLDRVLQRMGEKPVEIAAQKNNPFTAGTVRADTAYRIGDTYRYRVNDIDSGSTKPPAQRLVTAITESEVIYNDGRVKTDLLGNPTLRADGRKLVGAQLLPTEYVVGKTWVTRFHGTGVGGAAAYTEQRLRIVARERITVPAGTFVCYRIEAEGVSRPFLPPLWHAELSSTNWMAPDECRVSIRLDNKAVVYDNRGRSVPYNDRRELESFKQA